MAILGLLAITKFIEPTQQNFVCQQLRGCKRSIKVDGDSELVVPFQLLKSNCN